MKTDECEALEAQVREIEKRVETLETQLKEQERSLNDEEFLFANSAAYKRLSFNLWVHNKYHQLQDSDGPNPQLGDVEELSRDLQKYFPPESYNMGTHHIRILLRGETNYIGYENQFLGQTYQ